MSLYQDVFERKEVKYRLSPEQYAQVVAALAGRMAPDAYGKTTIVSRYLDTSTRALIERSLDKPLYKEKLRVRSYGEAAAGPATCGALSTRDVRAPFVGAPLGVPAEAGSDGRPKGRPYDSACESDPADAQVFIELKKKFKGIVYKRRVSCTAAAAKAYLGGMPYEQACRRFPLASPEAAEASLSAKSRQIAAEIDAFMSRNPGLMPSMLIACERVAFAPVLGVDGVAPALPDVPDDLRITFDENVRYRDLFARHASWGSLLAPGEAIMEVKSSGPFPLWLVDVLDGAQAYPSSFSKYGAAYAAVAACA